MECSRVEMLKKIQCSNFAAYDMLLYLDTHSDDKKAFRMFQALVKKTKELKCEYEEKFGPLNQFSAVRSAAAFADQRRQPLGMESEPVAVGKGG